MAFMTWNDSLSVKIESIDEQHKKLIEMINDFYDNVGKKSNDELISKLVKGMKNYTLMHFGTEERYMKQFDFPNFEQHKKEHDAFISKVNDLEVKLKSGKAILSFEITNFLKDWIKNHIQEEDRQYSGLFLKNGLQ
jgi:hemerythrin